MKSTRHKTALPDALEGSGRAARLTRARIWCIFAVAATASVLPIVFGIASLVADMAGNTISVGLAARRPLPAEADAGTARIVSGTYSSAELV